MVKTGRKKDRKKRNTGRGWRKSYIIVAVDCARSMREGDPSHFQQIMKVIYDLLDSFILSKDLTCKLAVVLFSPDKKAESPHLISFDTPINDAMCTVQALQRDDSTFFSEYNANDTVMDFFEFMKLIHSLLKDLKGNTYKRVLYISGNGDPCTKPDVKQRVLNRFSTFGLLRRRFDLFPFIDNFDFEPFFKEAYKCLHRKPPTKYYYDKDSLHMRLMEMFHFSSKYTGSRIHVSCAGGTHENIACWRSKASRSGKLLPNVKIDRQTREVVQPRQREVMCKTFSISLGPKRDKEIKTMDMATRNKVYSNCPVPLGYTIISGSTTRYSTPGLFYSTTEILTAKPAEKFFPNLWQSAVNNSLYLLCLVRYKKNGKVHFAELAPYIFGKQKCFACFILPNCLTFVRNEREISKLDKEELVTMCRNFVTSTTATDLDQTRMKPCKYRLQEQYLRKELMGAEYVEKPSVDWITQKIYQGDPSAIVDEWKRLYPNESTGKKRTYKKPAGGASKKSKS